MVDRSSEADEPELIKDPDEKARVEALNTLRQFDATIHELRRWLRTPSRRLRPSDISALHRVLMDRISEYAGVYRPAKIKIIGSRHAPPPADQVQRLVEELCDYLAENWEKKPSVHLAAYSLWRINWIHPFSDGNGRTARAVSYLTLCAHSGKELPGDLTIPEQIARNKAPYYKALEAADAELQRGRINLSILEQLLNSHLANQLYDFYQTVSGDRRVIAEIDQKELDLILEEAKNEGAEDRKAVIVKRSRERTGVLAWLEKHPALVSLIGTIVVAVIAGLFALFGKH
jgi:Fic family protein